MTALSDFRSISLSGNAIDAGHVCGVNLPGLAALAHQHIAELEIVLKQIIKIHPTSGGDAANLAALNAAMAELAPNDAGAKSQKANNLSQTKGPKT